MKQILYTVALILLTSLGAEAAFGQGMAPEPAVPAQYVQDGPWTDLAVGVTASFHRRHLLRSARTAALKSRASGAPAIDEIQSRHYTTLRTSEQGGGTAQHYFLVSPERASNTPLWLADLYSLRESMQRSTTYEGSGVWMGLDPMNLRATLKLEIKKIVNVLD